MVDTKKLEDVAARLNKKSDDINVIIRKVEDKIQSYNLGLEVWLDEALCSQDIEMEEGKYGKATSPFLNATSRAHELYLGYAKTTEDGWCLAVQEREVYYAPNMYDNLSPVIVGSYNLTEPRPLLKASRENRISALGQLQDLLDTISKKAESVIEQIEKARQIAEEL